MSKQEMNQVNCRLIYKIIERDYLFAKVGVWKVRRKPVTTAAEHTTQLRL